MNFFGDLGELGQIRNYDLFYQPLISDAPDKQAGYAIYISFDECILLEETMKQGPDQIPLLQRLLRIRFCTATRLARHNAR